MAEVGRPHRQPAIMGLTSPTNRSTRDRRSRRSHRDDGTQPRSTRNPVSSQTYQAANVVGERVLPPLPVPANLHGLDGDAFNIDPGVPYLESGGIDPEQGHMPERGEGRANGMNFVGGLVTGLRRAMMKNYRPETQRPMDYPVGRMSDITTNPPVGYEHTAFQGLHSTAQSIDDSGVGFAPPEFIQHHSPPLDIPSDNAHASHGTVDTHDGETTAVSHDILPPPPVAIGSPVLVEPLPGSDYAKMDSPTPPPSDMSLTTYLARIQKFFRDLNDLPWVAQRVTVDYYPRQSKGYVPRPQIPIHRPTPSWYNQYPARMSVDLLSGSSSPSTQNHHRPRASTIPVATLAYGYAPQTAVTMPPPMSYRVPGPTVPMYPNGYVPYQPVVRSPTSGSVAGGYNPYVPMSQAQTVPVMATMARTGSKSGY